MFNLLLLKDKIFLLREYRLRVAIVALCLLSVSIFIGAVLLIPSYVWSRLELSNVEDQLSLKKNNDDAVVAQTISAKFSDANQYVNLLSKTKDVKLLGVIKKIVGLRGEAVRISDFQFTRTGDSDVELSIVGVANARQDLVDFSDRLKKDPSFDGVVVPLSSYVKDNDIPFSIKMTAKLQ